MRLLLPGWEGNTNVKWLRRLKLGTEPFMTRWETSKYTDPLPGGKARMFSFEMDAKSIITSPAYPERLVGPGLVADHRPRVERARHASRASTSAPTAARRGSKRSCSRRSRRRRTCGFSTCGSGTAMRVCS